MQRLSVGDLDTSKLNFRPTWGVSFGLPQNSDGNYPINPYGDNSVVNPYPGYGASGQGGLNLGLVSVNPLVAVQVTKDDYGEKVIKPFVNLHVTPNQGLVHKLGSILNQKKEALLGGHGGYGGGYGGGYPGGHYAPQYYPTGPPIYDRPIYIDKPIYPHHHHPPNLEYPSWGGSNHHEKPQTHYHNHHHEHYQQPSPGGHNPPQYYPSGTPNYGGPMHIDKPIYPHHHPEYPSWAGSNYYEKPQNHYQNHHHNHYQQQPHHGHHNIQYNNNPSHYGSEYSPFCQEGDDHFDDSLYPGGSYSGDIGDFGYGYYRNTRTNVTASPYAPVTGQRPRRLQNGFNHKFRQQATKATNSAKVAFRDRRKREADKEVEKTRLRVRRGSNRLMG